MTPAGTLPLPRKTTPAPAKAGTVRAFMERNFRHFNARDTLEAAVAYESHIAAGGKMMVALAGAMSTAEIGKTLARMVRADKVHAISCTGANLEEDVFNLVGNKDYERVKDWRALTPEMDQAFFKAKLNRVTDTTIPAGVMAKIEKPLVSRWRKACAADESHLPSEYLFDVLLSKEIDKHFQIPREESWLLACAEKKVPVWTPGWEDSTCGQFFAAQVSIKEVPSFDCVKSGPEQFAGVMDWYLKQKGKPAPGFFQIGGGIAGDFAICAVPAIVQDMEKKAPFWGYFAQITDATPSYGGYSGATPNEKITWGKLEPDTPKFDIHSDATIVAPLIFSYVLGD